jgi:hypothetical protein
MKGVYQDGVLRSAAFSVLTEIKMPHKSAEQLKQKTARLKKKLAEKAASMDVPAVRAAKKKIRRAQRSRRTIEQRAKRLAGKTEAPPA